MKKIPTLFKRTEDRRYVIPEVTPGCEWVLAGDGRATRKIDGTCVLIRMDGMVIRAFARREVKPGKEPPTGWVEEDHDEATGKRVGWEPAAQSPFGKIITQVIDDDRWLPYDPEPGTYELVGPKVNGNPENAHDHLLVRHGYEAADWRDALAEAPRDFDGLKAWLLAHDGWEGIVWHHPDGRMAKLKRRDFPPREEH